MNLERNDIEDGRESLRREIAALKAELEHARSGEAEMREKLAFRGDVLSSMRDWYWEVNERFMLRYCSDGVRDTLGYTPEEMIGHSPLEFILPEDGLHIKRTAMDVFQSRQPFKNVESWSYTRDGGMVYFLVSGTPFFNEKGEFQGYRGINRDITERKQMELVMREVRDLALSLGSIRDLTEGLSLCLRTTLTLGGMDAGGVYLVDRSDGSLHLVVSEGLFPEFIERVSCYPADSPNTRMLMNGQPMYTRASDMGASVSENSLPEGIRLIAVIPILHQGAVIGGFNIASFTLNEFPALLPGIAEALIAPIGNAIARLQSEQAIRESEMRYRAIVEDIPLFICRFLPDGTITFANEAYSRHYNRPREQLIGVDIFSLIPEGKGEIERLRHLSRTPEDSVHIVTHPAMVPGLGLRWHRWTERALFENGRLVEFQSIGEDITEQHNIIGSLREKTDTLDAIFEIAPYIMMLVDGDCRVVDVNREGKSFAGREETYILGTLCGEVIGCVNAEGEKECGGGEDCPECPLRARVGHTLRTGEALRNGEARIVVRRGNATIPLDLLISTSQVNTKEGDRVLVTLVDISERKQAELALKETAEKLAATLNSIPDLLFEVDRAGTIYDYHSPAHELLYVPPDVFLNKTIGEVIPADAARCILAALDRASRQGWDRGAEYALDLPQGKRWFELSIETKGEDDRFIVLARDVTARIQSDEALKRSEEKFQKAFHSTPVSLSISSLNEGRFIEINEENDAFLGFSAEEVMGKTSLELGIWTNLEDRQNVVRSLMAGEPVRDREYRLRLKNGKIAITRYSASLLDIGGEPCILSAFVDITESKLLEQQFLQAQKMETIGRLAGGVAHDFNNLLTVINANAELALMFMDPKDPYYEPFEEIKKSGERAANLTRQLLAFSRKQITEPRVINLNKTLMDMDKMLRRLIGENIEMKTIPDDALFPVKADPGQIEQVITNLVVNARDAMPDGGKLTLETKNVFLDEQYAKTHPETISAWHVMLAVSDTGIGMSEEVLSHIFEPFFTTKPVGTGTGLGLSTSYGIVKQNRGGIWVYSEPGKGTTVKVYLPAIEDEARILVEDREKAVLVDGTETVLVVEDDADIRKLVVRHLKARGYRVLSAANGDEALALVNKHADPIDLLITDMVMPLMGGRELADNLALIRPGMHVLFMSGYTGNSIVHQGILNHEIKFIQKPFSMAEFLKKIREAIEES